MLVASDFREQARNALSGKWGLAIGTGFVAGLLGAGTIFTASADSIDVESYEESMAGMSEDAALVMSMIILVMLGIALIYALVVLIVGGPVTLGYVKFNLGLVDYGNPQFNDIFSQFDRFGAGFLVNFLRNLYVGLWTMAFVLPGVIVSVLFGVVAGLVLGEEVIAAAVVIILLAALIPALIFVTVKQYSYAMAPYILYENPSMSANQAIKKSTELMKGNKWRLFCLCFSFIGWLLLSIFFTCGIGMFWVKPYQEAAFAAFYREIAREKYGSTISGYRIVDGSAGTNW